MRHRSGLVLSLWCAAGAGCSRDAPLAPCPPQQPVAAAAVAVVARLPATRYDALIAAAARAHDIDAGLLKAIAWTETRFHETVPEDPDEPLDHHGQPAAWGVMALRGERMERAAGLAGLDAADVRRSAAAGITAAAALLAEEARAAGVAHLPPSQWAPALERYSGIDGAAGRSEYARVVLQATANADADRAATGSTDPCSPVTPPREEPSSLFVWRASPNFNQRASGVAGQVAMIIVHTCEGNYTGCWSWLINTVSQVSAHYVVNEAGTEISQLVDESARAWHIGASYDCTLNRSRRCDLNGAQSNHFTVGIEHAGFASQQTFPSQQIDVSAQLTCAISRRHNIPRDFQHIVAHGQLQPWNRTDPGPNWPWVRYITSAQQHCGEVVIDDDAAFNDADVARSSGSAVWASGSETAGYYGGGYRFAATSPASDDAIIFEFQLTRAGEHSIDARWTAGTNRSNAARFTIRNGHTAVAAVDVDQRVGHGEWHTLARLQLPAGWHRVELSRRGAEGNVVVADAIRVR